MKYDSDEALERALFALDLEQPPADLRASILASTVYRAPAIITLPEAAGLFALLGMVAWVCTSILMGGMPLFSHALTTIQVELDNFFGNTETMAWLAVGGAIAISLSLWPNQPLVVRQRIARR